MKKIFEDENKLLTFVITPISLRDISITTNA